MIFGFYSLIYSQNHSQNCKTIKKDGSRIICLRRISIKLHSESFKASTNLYTVVQEFHSQILG